MPLAANGLENLGFLSIRVLAVVGGAVVGALLTSFLVWLAGKYWFKRQAPWPAKKLLRTLGAIAGALLVASFLHLSGGGWGLFGGGGIGTGDTGDRGGSKGQQATNQTKDQTSPGAAIVAPGSERVRVTILGGALVHPPAFYRVEGRPGAVELKDVQDAIRGRRDPGKPLAAVDILIYDNSLGQDTEPVKKLQAWVRESGLTPNLMLMPGEIPGQ
ncbi:MAG TPA: hypothetical protein VL371_17755 [Gemmataceae bacterium]|nr:hypothetical protein [Gemmataceae bacterium]